MGIDFTELDALRKKVEYFRAEYFQCLTKYQESQDKIRDMLTFVNVWTTCECGGTNRCFKCLFISKYKISKDKN